MKERALVVNKFSGQGVSGCKYGCNPFKKPDPALVTKQLKQKNENDLSLKLSSLATDGYELLDEKVFTHRLYVENYEVETGLHGVYRYIQSGKGKRYKVYFGPFIIVPYKKKGCFGCGNFKLGCGSLKGGCGSIKGGCKNLGCKSEGGNNQYLNFIDNNINEPVVQKLNEHFHIQRGDKREDEGYRFYDIEINLVMSEFVKNHYEELLNQYNSDISTITSQGYGFEKIIDVPSDDELYTQAMLFSSDSQDKVTFSNIEVALKHITFLHRFDLWYFPRMKGLLRRIWDGFLSMLHLLNEDKIVGTSYIEDENIQKLEKVYSDDFNAQSETEAQMKSDIDEATKKIDKIVGKIPVTLAVQLPQGWLSRMFNLKHYTYTTLFIPGMKE